MMFVVKGSNNSSELWEIYYWAVSTSTLMVSANLLLFYTKNIMNTYNEKSDFYFYFVDKYSNVGKCKSRVPGPSEIF